MRLADAPIDLERPIRLLERGGWVIVKPAEVTMLRAADKVCEVYTHRGYVGALTTVSVRRLADLYPGDWVALSRAAIVRRSAILRIDHQRGNNGRKVARAARVAGAPEPVAISRRHWKSVRQALIGG